MTTNLLQMAMKLNSFAFFPWFWLILAFGCLGFADGGDEAPAPEDTGVAESPEKEKPEQEPEEELPEPEPVVIPNPNGIYLPTAKSIRKVENRRICEWRGFLHVVQRLDLENYRQSGWGQNRQHRRRKHQRQVDE